MKDFSKQFIANKKEIKNTFKLKIYIFISLAIALPVFLIFQLLLKNSETYEFKSPVGGVLGEDDVRSNLKMEDADSLGALLQNIENIVKGKQGTYGFFVNSLSDNLKYGINENMVFTAASINKVPIVVNYLMKIEEGDSTLSETYTLKEEDIEYGSGTMQNQKVGSVFTYDELVRFIGKYSDNTAINVIIRKIGKNETQDQINKWGMSGTDLEMNKTTPMEMGMLFSKIYKGMIFKKKDMADYFFDTLTNTEYETRIPAGLPTEVRVAHKIGNQIQVWSDCGVVFGNKPYTICILTDGIKEEEAMEILPKISKLVWGFEENR